MSHLVAWLSSAVTGGMGAVCGSRHGLWMGVSGGLADHFLIRRARVSETSHDEIVSVEVLFTSKGLSQQEAARHRRHP